MTTYTIRVEGHLDDHWSTWLGALDLSRDADGGTTLTVSVADQAQLHGVLARLRDIGAVLTDLRRARAPSGTGGHPDAAGGRAGPGIRRETAVTSDTMPAT